MSPKNLEKNNSQKSREKIDLFNIPNNDFEVEIELENSLD